MVGIVSQYWWMCQKTFRLLQAIRFFFLFTTRPVILNKLFLYWNISLPHHRHAIEFIYTEWNLKIICKIIYAFNYNNARNFKLHLRKARIIYLRKCILWERRRERKRACYHFLLNIRSLPYAKDRDIKMCIGWKKQNTSMYTEILFRGFLWGRRR